jgi:hypothetical protein
MANIGSTSSQDELHHHHVGWDYYFILGWMYWELLDLEKWTFVRVFRLSQYHVSLVPEMRSWLELMIDRTLPI